MCHISLEEETTADRYHYIYFQVVIVHLVHPPVA